MAQAQSNLVDKSKQGLLSGINTSNIFNVQPKPVGSFNINAPAGGTQLAGTLGAAKPMPQSTVASLPQKPLPAPITPQPQARPPVASAPTTQPGTQPQSQTPQIQSSNTYTPTPQTSPSTTTPAPTQPTQSFSGYVSQLANTATQGNPVANQAAQGLLGISGQNPGTSGPAYDKYSQAVENLRKLKSDIASQYGNIENTPIPLEFQQGREQVLARQYASQLEAAQAAVNEQEAALGYQISGQQTQNQGYGAAGGIGTTQSGQAISGLGAAAGFAQPQLGSYGQYQYNPLNPNQSQGALDPNMQAQMLAQKVMSGQMSYQDAVSALGYAGGAGQTFLNNAINSGNQGFNFNASQGQSAAQQYNSQTAGSAMTQANLPIYQQGLQQTAEIQAATQAIQSFGVQLLDTMVQAGINPTSSQFVNKTINQLKSEFSSPEYAMFNTNIQGLQARIADMLGKGEIPSTATFGAQEIANGNLKLPALEATLRQVVDEANSLAQSRQTQATNAYSNLTGNNGSQPNPWH